MRIFLLVAIAVLGGCASTAAPIPEASFDACLQEYYPYPNQHKKRGGVYTCYRASEDPTYGDALEAEKLHCELHPKHCKRKREDTMHPDSAWSSNYIGPKGVAGEPCRHYFNRRMVAKNHRTFGILVDSCGWCGRIGRSVQDVSWKEYFWVRRWNHALSIRGHHG